ncbi:glycosyltransferase [Weissella koreensis]|uniref:glycosyltransferase n=1 Tax=Weissella koreensis TaxID=165096 RepID=UPI00026F449E|nr:glycosyltransferase [Weissella koreensis]EJF34794.1 glycosyltransferase [Weissella koreensis KCTC 3621]MCZ9311514.1 glycosyltransferase [Weissella koreensis]
MNFFVNKAMGHGNSGVEHAQFYRADRFREKQIPFKFIFNELLPNLHQHMKEWNLKESEVINVFDFLMSDNPNEYALNGIKETYESENDTLWDLTNTQRIIKTKTSSGYKMTTLRNKIYSTEKEIYLVSDDRIFLENGKHKLTWKVRDDKDLGNVMESIHLDEFNGANYFFNTFEEMLSFFYTELEKIFENNTYILDRGSENEEALVDLRIKGHKFHLVEIMHAAHLSNFIDGHPVWNQYYQYMFDHLKWIDYVVVATELQKKDMQKHLKMANLPYANRIINIPVGGVKHISPAKKWNKKHTMKLVTASRLHEEKHISHIIRAIKKLKENAYDVTLDIFGAGAEHDELAALIKELKLSDIVTLKGLSQDVVKDIAPYDAFVGASYSEGFGLTYIEAISDSLPIASYANLYGAQELITDGKNGSLASFDRNARDQDEIQKNVDNLAASIEKIFKNYNKLSIGAREVAEKYQAKIIAIKWEVLMGELK